MDTRSPTGRLLFGAFDLMRILAACMAAAIHIYIPASRTVYFVFNDTLARAAVPFFFAAAGFFGAGRDKKEMVAYLRRIGILYLMWTAVYLPVVIGIDLTGPAEPFASALLRYVRNFLYFGVSGHLWYYPALLTAAVVVWLLGRRFSPGGILSVSALFFIFAVLAESYYGVLPHGILKDAVDFYFSIFPNARNGLLFGFFFVSLGGYLRYRPVPDIRRALAGLIAGAGLLLAESALIQNLAAFRDRNLYFSLVPLTYSLIRVLQSVRTSGTGPRRNGMYRELRRMSVVIYGSHVITYYLLIRLFPVLTAFPLAAYLGALMLSAVCYAAIRLVSGFKPMRFLAYFY